MVKRVCVVIPIHTSTPSEYEIISFRQCYAILGKHAIKIVAPVGLDLSVYKRYAKDLDVIFIDSKWQSSLVGYNKLKISRYFYKLFSKYEFLLTYELDSFVFRDDLDYWCDKGYDYIGAPWFEGFDIATPEAKLIGVGNSGFSLRNVRSAQNVLKSIFYVDPSELRSGRRSALIAYAKFPYRWVRNQFSENYTLQSAPHINEDIFFSHIAPEYYKNFKLAPIQQAVNFSFEVRPSVLYKLNQLRLPTGCHAWWRYDIEFWKPHIEGFGYVL